MVMRRRQLISILGIGLLQQQQLYPNMDDDMYMKWKALEIRWNAFSERLKAGVFDVKLWEKTKVALRDIGVCQK